MAFEECNTFNKDQHKSYNWTKFYEQKWTNNNVILFFHWNAWRACDRSVIKNILEKTNSTIIFMEYFWYSDKNNTPNLKSILNDIENMWEYINKNKSYSKK